MPNSSRVNFNIQNLTYSVAALLKGVSFVGGITMRGPVADPKDIITTWAQFEKIFGGFIPSSDFPLLCKRALDRGAQLRVSSIRHYTDITDASTLTAVKSTTSAFANSTPSNLFSLPLKNPGADGDNIRSQILDASNGQANYFNLRIYHISDPTINELYENLKIPGTPTAPNSHYLDSVKKSSTVVDVTYNDLSALVAPLRPVNVTKTYSGGDDGDPVIAGDYIGDSAAKTGIYAFDGYDDAMQVAFPEISDTTVHVAGSAYAATRKDLMYFAHLDNGSTTASALIADRDATNIDSMYTAFFAGGLKVFDPVSGVEKQISELGDILGVAAYSDYIAHEWFSFAGQNRGIITNALGVVNNFGSSAMYADLNLLANRQINMVVNADRKIYLSGNFSGQLSTDAMSWINAVRLIIFQQKSMGPLLKKYLEEPADIISFKKIYRGVEPFLETLKVQRAIFSYVWDGDQNISKIEDAIVNNLTDLQNGKYKVRLFEKIIPTLNEITVEITVTPLSVSFAVVQSQPNI